MTVGSQTVLYSFTQITSYGKYQSFNVPGLFLYIIILSLSGNNEVVHVSGIGGRVASNSGHSFSVSGVLFNKAEVKRENVFDVLGTSKCKVNNSKDNGNK